MEFLQLLAPGKSRTDGTTACGMILSGQAFAEFSDEERRIIWSRMQNFDGLIPSLYTFFEDFKYLEACAHCVKRLCGPIEMSIWRTMSSIFIPPSEEGTATSGAADSLIQTSESTFRRQPATDMERLETGYLQIWLYAMRHYTLMPPDPKSDDELLAKSTRAKPDERAIYEMAELAHQLGFQSPEIDALIKSSPDPWLNSCFSKATARRSESTSFINSISNGRGPRAASQPGHVPSQASLTTTMT